MKKSQQHRVGIIYPAHSGRLVLAPNRTRTEMSRLSSETAALPAPAKLPTPTSQPLTPQPKAALSIAISGSDINIRATDGDIEIAAAKSE